MVRSPVMRTLGPMHVLERPHGKSRKKGQTRLQSDKTTKHQRIMPYSRASFNQGSQAVALIDDSLMFGVLRIFGERAYGRARQEQ